MSGFEIVTYHFLFPTELFALALCTKIPCSRLLYWFSKHYILWILTVWKILAPSPAISLLHWKPEGKGKHFLSSGENRVLMRIRLKIQNPEQRAALTQSIFKTKCEAWVFHFRCNTSSLHFHYHCILCPGSSSTFRSVGFESGRVLFSCVFNFSLFQDFCLVGFAFLKES